MNTSSGTGARRGRQQRAARLGAVVQRLQDLAAELRSAGAPLHPQLVHALTHFEAERVETIRRMQELSD
ncbi:MAG: hypothetical protein JWQ18_413 [Conexibacter sp.]|nr:hypothetical protein [Conexibacter sp.]